MNKNNDKITIQIKCSSETCNKLRDDGLFFDSIAEALDINRDDIIEIEDDLIK
ncbi:hypothetical protein KAU09_00325 [Candidatus Parcubacteria bacterium]|nr:hypothetical protein [Candidatus Parcubacteria bacterium]